MTIHGINDLKCYLKQLVYNEELLILTPTPREMTREDDLFSPINITKEVEISLSKDKKTYELYMDSFTSGIPIKIDNCKYYIVGKSRSGSTDISTTIFILKRG